MKIWPGYDMHSPTLRASPLFNDCLRHLIDDRYVTVWTDVAAPIFSGDFVRLWINYADGVETRIVKRLRVSRDGTSWWGECIDGFFQIGTLVRPHLIEKVVGLSTEPLIKSPLQPMEQRKASPEQIENYAMLAAGVVEEWKTHGHRDGVPFPGLNRVNYYLSDGFTKNPEYAPPQPLERA